MRIIVFSDVHGNQYAMRAFCQRVKELSPDRIYFLGDIFGYYYGQIECLDLLRSMPKVQCVLGNHDNMFLNALHNKDVLNQLAEKYGKSYLQMQGLTAENISYIYTWPDFISDELDGMKVCFCHGTLENYLEGRLYPDGIVAALDLYRGYDVVFHGHTHHKILKIAGRTRIYNPGSLGQQRDGKGCSFILFDTRSGEASFETVEYDIGKLVHEIEKYDPDKQNFIEVLFRQAED